MRLYAPFRRLVALEYYNKLPLNAGLLKFDSLRLYMSGNMPSSKAAQDFITFVNDSPSPYHAVQGVRERLEAAEFEHILEREDWSSKCRPGGKYYLTRNASTILAFTVGAKWAPGGPIAMIGAHTDSPCLRVKVSLFIIFYSIDD